MDNQPQNNPQQPTESVPISAPPPPVQPPQPTQPTISPPVPEPQPAVSIPLSQPQPEATTSPQLSPPQPQLAPTTNPPAPQPQPTISAPLSQPIAQQDTVVVGGSPAVPPGSPAPAPKNVLKKRSKMPMMVGLALVFILILAGGVFAAYQHFSNTSVANCGTVTVTNATFTKSPYTGCFDQHYSDCTPAVVTVDNQSNLLKGTVNKYQIVSKQGTSCLVQWQYVALPINPKIVGKTVTCPYKEGSDFGNAFNSNSSFTGCTGPLLSALTSGSGSASSNSSSSSSGNTTQFTTPGSSTGSVTSTPTTGTITTGSSTSQ